MGASRLVVCRQPHEGGKQEEDAALVAAVQAGDVGAFAELFRRHHLAVKRVCARRLGEVEADEVAQATFVRAFERIDQCLGDRRFGAWVQVIAQRLCLDLVRARARTVPVDDPLRDHRPALNVVIDLDAGTVTEEAIVRRERTERVQEALALLPDRQREVVVARHFEGRRPPEIAASLGLSVGAVDSLLLRARRRLAVDCEHVLADGPAAAPPSVTSASTGVGMASGGMPVHLPSLNDVVNIAHHASAALSAIQSDVHAPLRRLAVVVAAVTAPILMSPPQPAPPAVVNRPAAGTLPPLPSPAATGATAGSSALPPPGHPTHPGGPTATGPAGQVVASLLAVPPAVVANAAASAGAAGSGEGPVPPRTASHGPAPAGVSVLPPVAVPAVAPAAAAAPDIAPPPAQPPPKAPTPLHVRAAPAPPAVPAIAAAADAPVSPAPAAAPTQPAAAAAAAAGSAPSPTG